MTYIYILYFPEVNRIFHILYIKFDTYIPIDVYTREIEYAGIEACTHNTHTHTHTHIHTHTHYIYTHSHTHNIYYFAKYKSENKFTVSNRIFVLPNHPNS